jgi:hypothetical protein
VETVNRFQSCFVLQHKESIFVLKFPDLSFVELISGRPEILKSVYDFLLLVVV